MVRGLVLEVVEFMLARDTELVGLVDLLVNALIAWLHNDSCATQARELSKR